jgi:HEAT repeat protein
MFLFGPPNVKVLKTKRDVKGLIRALNYQKDYAVRLNAVKALGELKDSEAAEPLLRILDEASENEKKHNYQLSIAAVDALGEMGDVKSLIKALECQKDYDIRLNAVKALGELKDSRVVEPLISLLTKLSSDEKSHYDNKKIDAIMSSAVRILGELKDSRAVEPLISILTNLPNDEKSHYTKISAAGVLGELRDSRAIKPLLNILADRPMGNLTTVALHALANIGDASAVDQLISCYKKYPRYLWENIAIALEQICTQTNDKTIHKQVAELFTSSEILTDDEHVPAQNIAKTLIYVGFDFDDPILNQKIIDSLAIIFTQGRASSIVEKTLINLGDHAIEPLIKALQSTKNWLYAEWTISLLDEVGGIRDPRVIDFAMRPGITEHVERDILEKMGWVPDKSRAGAEYWISKKQWDKCIQIGEPAIEPLIDELRLYVYDYGNSYTGNTERKKQFDFIADVLVKIGNEKAILPLAKILIEGADHKFDDDRKETLAATLAKLGKTGVECLIAILQNENIQEKYKHCQGYFDTLVETKAHVAVAKGLSYCRNAKAVNALIDTIDRDKARTYGGVHLILVSDRRRIYPLQVMKAAVESLGKIGDKKAVAPLCAILDHPDEFDYEYVRSSAAESLGQIDDTRAIASLTKALTNDSRNVRDAAKEALDKIQGKTK